MKFEPPRRSHDGQAIEAEETTRVASVCRYAKERRRREGDAVGEGKSRGHRQARRWKSPTVGRGPLSK